MVKPAIIGKDGRTTALAKTFLKSRHVKEVVHLSDWKGRSKEAAFEEVLKKAEDIGTRELVSRRCDHMRQLLAR